MGIVESLAKQKRKLDDVTCNSNSLNEKKAKHAKTLSSASNQRQFFAPCDPSTVANPDQGRASSSLAKLINSGCKKSSIFESLHPSDSAGVLHPIRTNPGSSRIQDGSLSFSILGNKRGATATNNTSSTTISVKTKKYKIVTNSSKVSLINCCPSKFISEVSGGGECF